MKKLIFSTLIYLSSLSTYAASALYDSEAPFITRLQLSLSGQVTVGPDKNKGAAGPGLTIEYPLSDWFTLGGRLALPVFFKKAPYESHPFTSLDVDAYFKLRFPIETSHGFLALYFSLPIGFTLGIQSIVNHQTFIGTGWNVGGIPGIEWFSMEQLGLYFEAGYVRRDYGSSQQLPFFASPSRIVTEQAQINMGLKYVI